MTRVPRWLRRTIVPVAILVVWQILASTGSVNAQLTSSPFAVASSLYDMSVTGQLGPNLEISLIRAVSGLVIGALLGLITGIAAGVSRIGEDALDSSVQAIRTLPYLGMVPLFILWFGLGETPRILMVAFGAFFPMYLNVFKGIRSVDERLIDLGHGYHLSRWQMLREVIFPATLPTALVGLRYSIGTAWVSLVVAEQINASSGLGYLIVQADNLAQTSVIITALVIYAAIGILADLIVRLVERRALRWQQAFQGA